MKNLIQKWNSLPYRTRYDIRMMPFKFIFVGALIYGAWYYFTKG